MKKFIYFSLIIFAFLIVPSFSFAETETPETITLEEAVCVHKGYQNTQVIYKLSAQDTVKVLEVQKKWKKISFTVNPTSNAVGLPSGSSSEEVIEGWICVGSNWEGPGLSPEQQEYLRDYVCTYVRECNAQNFHLYYQSVNGFKRSYDMILSNGTKNGKPYKNKFVQVCSSFVGTMLHQALGAPLWGETVDGVTYPIAGIRGTGFANPKHNPDTIFNVGGEYLEPGDILTYAGYGTHAGIYIGRDPASGYHQVAENAGPLFIDVIPGSNTMGEKITIGQVYSAYTKKKRWACASRIKYSCLPKDWEQPDEVKINWPTPQ